MATPSKLSYEVFVSDPIPFSDTDKAPNGDRRMFQPISSTLIFGVRDAVLVGARVVKALNTLLAAVLVSNPVQGGGRRVIFTSSDDLDASAAVAALCERLGFYPIDLGRISHGGRLQHFDGPLSGQNLVRMD